MTMVKTWVRLGLALLLMLLWATGCSGVLFEKQHDDGRVDRLKIDGGEGWGDYEDRPRLPQSRTKDDYYLAIKKELTF
ncbi:MAG: hypothetical protein ACYDIC_06705 [Desulfobaccales bacterium]